MREQTGAKRVLRFLLTFAIAYAFALILLRVFEHHFLFFPDSPGRLEGDWRPQDLPVQDVWIPAYDGTKLHAWWIPNEKAQFTFLVFHGNAGNIAHRAYLHRFLVNIPANVLALEYRGYGKSEGKPSEQDLYRDAHSAYEFLNRQKNADPKNIISLGQSLGTTVAADLASKDVVGGLILEAPFPSVASVVRRAFWFLPGLDLLVRSQFDTGSKLPKIKVPILIVQCTEDQVIPPELGQEVFDAARSPKSILKFNMSCHEEASLLVPAKYQAALREFLSKIDAAGNGEISSN